MFPTIRESAAVVSIILLLMLFLPSRLPSRYRRPIVVALLVVVLMLLLVPVLLQFFQDLGRGFRAAAFILPLAALFGHPSWGAALALPHSDKPCSYQDDQRRGYPSGCPSLYNACVVGRVVLPPLLGQRGLHIAPSPRCAGPWVVRP
jgi:hypothetical protein